MAKKRASSRGGKSQARGLMDELAPKLAPKMGEEKEGAEDRGPGLTAREQAYVERAQEAQRLQEQAFDRPTMTRAAMMLASLRGAGPLMVKRFEEGGEVDLAEQMTVGTLPEGRESLVDKKASELLRALAEAGRGFVGVDPIERGSEAYRTGQALSNMPAIGLAAGAVKGTGKLKNLTKKDIKAIAGELETSRGQLAEITKKYPQIREASVGEVEALTKGEPFTAYRGISLLPGRELRSETMPSTSLDPNVALGIIKDAPVMITRDGFITSTPVLRQYPGMKASETEVYVPSLIKQVRERQPGALEMKIPTRGGEKMSLEDIFQAVQGEKELLADVSKKSPKDILFNRYQGGIGDKYLMEVARKVLEGEWKGGESLLKEIGGYHRDPSALVKEFDDFAEMVKSTVLKKAQGGEVSTTDFIRKRQAGSPPEGEVPTDDYIQQMMVGTVPEDLPTASFGETLTKYGISPADAVAFLGRAGSAASLAMQPSEAKAMTMDEFLASRQAALDFEGAAPNEASATRALLQAVKSRNPAQGTQAVQEMLRMYSGFGDPIKGRFDVSRADPRADMGRALYASASPDVASQSAMDRLKSKLIQPTGMAVYPLDIPKQSILFMEETYPSGMAVKLKKFANKTSVPKGPTVTGEELYQGIRTLPKEKQGEAVRLLGFKGAQFLPGGKPLSTDNFAIFDTDGTVSAITGKQFKEGGEVAQFIKAHA